MFQTTNQNITLCEKGILSSSYTLLDGFGCEEFREEPHLSNVELGELGLF